jgi:hypothetical protein
MNANRLVNIELASAQLWEFILDYQSGIYDERPANEPEQYAIHELIKAVKAANEDLPGIEKLLNT